MIYQPQQPSPRHQESPQASTQPHPHAFTRILNAADHAINALSPTTPLTLGRVRGTGPGASFGSMIEELETAHPLILEYPFEGNDRIGGAVWQHTDFHLPSPPTTHPQTSPNPTPPSSLPTAHPPLPPAIAKIRWRKNATDLPLHLHAYTDRFIIVLEGRGFFHWSGQDEESFDGSEVQTIAARSRDVFVFRRGLLHTFSTQEHTMTLISVQSPFIPFGDSRQYRLPHRYRWTAGEQGSDLQPRMVCDLHAPSTSCPL